MRLVTAALLAALTVLISAASSDAQPLAWARLEGPHAAGLRTAAVSPTGVLLAATHVDVLRNGGSGWSGVAGAVNGSIHDISTAPGNRVWAGTSGALRSDDGGQTWQWFSIRTAPHSGTHPTVAHIAQAPNGVVYAGGFRTTNAGATWDQMSIYATATAFQGSTTFAGSFDGVHRSTNGGTSWTPSGLQGIPVDHMAVTGSRLVAATSAGILISEDGINWTPTCTLPQVTGLAVSGDGAVWASAPTGLFRSPDGIQWPFEPTVFPGTMVEDVAASGTTLLAMVQGNPHRSTDSGTTWQPVHDGLGMPFAASGAAAAGVLAVAARGAGPFHSVDGGVTWTRWTDGLPGESARTLLFDEAGGNAFVDLFGSLHRATLDGGAWQSIALPDGAEAGGLAFDGSALIAVADGDSMDHRVYRSTDAGATWTLAQTEPDSFQPRLVAGGGVVAVAAVGFFGPARLLVSTDGGVTWTPRPHPTSPLFGASPPMFADAAGRIYVEDGNRLLRSQDAGISWSELGPAGSGSNSVRSLHSDSDALCLGTSEGVWCSENDGTSFSAVNAGLPGGGVPVVSLMRDGERYAALTASDGVFVSDGATESPGAPRPASGLSMTVTPNPISDRAVATLMLSHDTEVALVLYDVLGRRVVTLHDGRLAAGVHSFPIDTARLAPGAYVVRLAAGDTAESMPVSISR